MRKFTEPHMLIHVVIGGVGVVLLLAGYAAGLFLVICAVMMGAMMAAMGGHSGHGGNPSDRSDRSGGQPGGRGHH